MLMAGIAIDGSGTLDLREVPQGDVVAYEAAGFERVETRWFVDEVEGGGWRYSEWGSDFVDASIEAPVSGEVDGVNTVFTFSGPIAACCLNNIISNSQGTPDGSTFTFDSAPVAGDIVTGVVGVSPWGMRCLLGNGGQS